MSLNGFLNINKPEGRTSRQVVTSIKTLLLQSGLFPKRLPKIGHAGTLDPLATGVLVVCLGHGTRFIERLHLQSKSYRGTFLFGKRSNTDDIEGDVVDVDRERAAQLTRNEVEASLLPFLGRIEQVPPTFSAVWVAGRRAYELARRGEEVSLKPKTVEIQRIEIVRFEPPVIELEIECSSGTYIRSLGRDLGARLGCGAIMCALSRTRVGSFDLSDSTPLGDLTVDSLRAKLHPCLKVVPELRTYYCIDADIELLERGAGIKARDEAWGSSIAPHTSIIPNSVNDPDGAYALLDPCGVLIGIGGWDDSRPVIRPRLNLITRHEPMRRSPGDSLEAVSKP